MGDHDQNVNTRFSVTDLATKPLRAITAAAQGMSSAFNRASSLVATFGGIAAVAGGAFSAREVITGTLSYLDTVKKVADTTGLAAEKADGMLSVMKGAGIEGETAAQMFMLMSRSGQRMAMQMEAARGAVTGVRGMIQGMGLDLKGGPEKAFLQLATLAEKHKLSVSQLSIAYRLPMDNARKLVQVLALGPKAVERSINELKESGLAVTGENLKTYSRIASIQNHIKETWERIMIVVGVKLLPVIEKLLGNVKEKLEGWLNAAKEFGETLGHFLKDHLHLVMQISKVLLLNAAIQRASGKGLGDWAGKGLSLVARAAGPMKLGAGSAMLAARADTGGAGGMVSGLINGLLKLRPIVSGLLRMTVVGILLAVAVAFIVKAVEMFKTNALGVRDIIMDIWTNLKDHVGVIATLLEKGFGSSSAIGHFFEVLVPTVFATLGTVVDAIMHTIEMLIIVVGKFATDFKKTIKNIGSVFAESWIEAGNMMRDQASDAGINKFTARLQDHMKPPDARSTMTQNFFNSRFDVTQKFAEGFDPDRVAVAFRSELSSLGERRMQSGFSPLFSAH